MLSALLAMAVAGLTGACGGSSTEARSQDPPDASAPATLTDLGAQLDDAMLGLRVRARLLEHLGAEALSLGLSVEDGAIVLTGTVANAASKPLAREVALTVEGVSSVSNRIEVATSGKDEWRPIARAVGVAEREVADAVLLTQVKLRLAQALGVRALDIDVDVRDAEVSLRGTLESPDGRRLAVATAEAVEGVEEVHDLLQVRP
jgi:osmotically-inducible protein OsmY